MIYLQSIAMEPRILTFQKMQKMMGAAQRLLMLVVRNLRTAILDQEVIELS